MGFLRTLFLGVYASNAAIRVLFMPLCYVLLLSPFFTLVGWYFGFDRTLSAYAPEDFTWTDLLPQIVLSAVFLLLPTRLISHWANASKGSNGGKRRVQSLPYWIPGFRNFWSLVSGGERWLRGVRNSAIDIIVVYNAFGAKHNVILADALTSDSILGQICKHDSDLQVPRSTESAVMRNAYNIPSNAEDQYFRLGNTIEKSINSEVFEEATQQLTSATLNILSESLPDFVTFNSSIVDQMQWERVSDVELTDGTSEAECNFWALINEFCCNAILPPILGAQFTESYQLLATDLATFNQSYWALALGLPRLAPVPGLPGAALAQKRLSQNLAHLFYELTNPPVKRVPDDDESVSGEETDADVATPMAKLNDVFKKHDLPLTARAAIALRIIHEIVAEVVPLVFWTLIHLHAASVNSETQGQDKSPIEKIKQDVGHWAQAIQPPSIHPSFPAPPEIIYSTGASGIKADSFLYLRSCINEARRLYGTSVATYQFKQPITIREASVRPGQHDEWELEAGSYIDVGLSQSLINSSPTVFPDPKIYKTDRFIGSGTSSIIFTNDKTSSFKTSLVIAIVSGIIQLWEIKPAPKKSFFEHMQEAREEAQMSVKKLADAKSDQISEKKSTEMKWKVPKAVEGSSVKVPKGDVRVRIRRREGLPAKVVGRR